MPRERRQVLRSLFTSGSRKFWRLKTDRARLFYIALILNADDRGRLEGDPKSLSSLVPMADWERKELSGYIKDLVSVGLVQEYIVDSEPYLQVVGFEESQSWHGVSREPSSIPTPPGTVDNDTNDGVSGSPRGQESSPLTYSKRESMKESKRLPKWARLKIGDITSTTNFTLNKGFETWSVNLCEKLGISVEKFMEVLEWVASKGDNLREVQNAATYIKANFEIWCDQYEGSKSPPTVKPNGGEREDGQLPKLVSFREQWEKEQREKAKRSSG